ncbi:hypothetical protein [Tessaracoccus sp. Z1128]
MSRNAAAMAAHRLLGDRLHELTDEGVRVPCHGSLLPISEDLDEREFVLLAWCPSCPALDACRAAGAYEQHGVWGGRDVTPQPKTSTRTTTTTTSKEKNR